MSSPVVRKAKSNKDDIVNMDELSRETKGIIDKILGDVGKASATKQLIIGTASGWCTGFITMKVGKAAALVVGGSVILLQIANHKGYIRVNWDRLNRQVDKITDKVEEKTSGEGPKWMDKVERYVDRNLDKAEEALRKKQRSAKKWYHSFIGDKDYFQVEEIHIFLASFVVGLAIGVAITPSK